MHDVAVELLDRLDKHRPGNREAMMPHDIDEPIRADAEQILDDGLAMI